MVQWRSFSVRLTFEFQCHQQASQCIVCKQNLLSNVCRQQTACIVRFVQTCGNMYVAHQVPHPPWDGRFLLGSVSQVVLRCHFSICDSQIPLNTAISRSVSLEGKLFRRRIISGRIHVARALCHLPCLAKNNGRQRCCCGKSELPCLLRPSNQALEMQFSSPFWFYRQMRCVACQGNPLAFPCLCCTFSIVTVSQIES